MDTRNRQIDRKTIVGRQIAQLARSLDPELQRQAAKVFRVHPALTCLPFKQLDRLLYSSIIVN